MLHRVGGTNELVCGFVQQLLIGYEQHKAVEYNMFTNLLLFTFGLAFVQYHPQFLASRDKRLQRVVQSLDLLFLVLVLSDQSLLLFLEILSNLGEQLTRCVDTFSTYPLVNLVPSNACRLRIRELIL